ncbi:hypothetical protein D3C86_1795020 [compost metagenome]
MWKFCSGNQAEIFSTKPMKVSLIQRSTPLCGVSISVNCSVLVSNFITLLETSTVNQTLSSLSARMVCEYRPLRQRKPCGIG